LAVGTLLIATPIREGETVTNQFEEDSDKAKDALESENLKAAKRSGGDVERSGGDVESTGVATTDSGGDVESTGEATTDSGGDVESDPA
jgi:hypothetical protein